MINCDRISKYLILRRARCALVVVPAGVPAMAAGDARTAGAAFDLLVHFGAPSGPALERQDRPGEAE